MIDKNEMKIDIGKRVKEIRTKMHMSKNAFAKLIGMKNQYLGTVENGQKGLTVEKVIEICKLTGVSSDYILFGVDNTIENKAKNVFAKYSSDEINTSFEILRDLILLTK